jgi:hypothetical protein
MRLGARSQRSRSDGRKGLGQKGWVRRQAEGHFPEAGRSGSGVGQAGDDRPRWRRRRQQKGRERRGAGGSRGYKLRARHQWRARQGLLFVEQRARLLLLLQERVARVLRKEVLLLRGEGESGGGEGVDKRRGAGGRRAGGTPAERTGHRLGLPAAARATTQTPSRPRTPPRTFFSSTRCSIAAWSGSGTYATNCGSSSSSPPPPPRRCPPRAAPPADAPSPAAAPVSAASRSASRSSHSFSFCKGV